MQSANEIDLKGAVTKIEYHLLSPTITAGDTIKGCRLAKRLELPAVCFKPCYILQAVSELRGSKTAPTTVIGYPFGDDTTYIKLTEAKRALTKGVLELNLVANISFLIEGNDDLFSKDLDTVCGLARMNGARVNVIVNCHYLTEKLIEQAAKLVEKAGADWISSSS